ncbi:PQ loop repeat [Novymonas esmeraldas]|uniref:PQ loop repeat n=1 Tax=Novymonas esmeraldas TaxID=1808958 RepID=A0AAW0EL11_9TRYP
MEVLKVCFEVALVFAPHIGYVSQYMEIDRSRSFAGYAPVVSLILLTSNTLRVYYYIGNHFLFALLCQAVVGIAVHGALLWKVLEVQAQQLPNHQVDDMYYREYGAAAIAAPSSGEAGLTTSGSTQVAGAPAAAKGSSSGEADAAAASSSHAAAAAAAAMWQTPAGEARSGYYDGDASPAASGGACGALEACLRVLFRLEDGIESRLLRHTPLQFVCSYVVTAAVVLATVLLYYVSIGRVWGSAAEVVGYTALGIEALLVLPQILRNARRRSTEGLTMLLILTWVGGDVVKVIYFVYAEQALAFIVCGAFQIGLDVVVVAQLIYYRFLVRSRGDSSVVIHGDDDEHYGDGAGDVPRSREAAGTSDPNLL